MRGVKQRCQATQVTSMVVFAQVAQHLRVRGKEATVPVPLDQASKASGSHLRSITTVPPVKTAYPGEARPGGTWGDYRRPSV